MIKNRLPSLIFFYNFGRLRKNFRLISGLSEFYETIVSALALSDLTSAFVIF